MNTFDDEHDWEQWNNWDPKPNPTEASINEIHTETNHIAEATHCEFVCFDMSGDIIGACKSLDDATDIVEVSSILNPSLGLAWARVVSDLSILSDEKRLHDPEEIRRSFMFSPPAPLAVGVALIAQMRMLDF